MPKLFTLVVTFLAATGLQAQAVKLLHHGHAHNDYSHARPLETAMEAGYTSLEIDVYRKRGKIRVSHWPFLLGTKPTLEELYLAPLRARISQNGGTVYPADSTQLVLMIDLKSDAGKLYPLLRAQFAQYATLIQTTAAGQTKWGPLRLVLTGGPPLDSLQAAEPRYFAADGNPGQWAAAYGPELMPRASTNYKRHFKWRGKGSMPVAEQQKLAELVALAHQHHRKIRFWAAPDHPAVWKALLDAGVDWINVDDLEGFRKFWFDYLR